MACLSCNSSKRDLTEEEFIKILNERKQMKGISANVICDSIDKRNNRLTTFVLRYPRFIHGELLTHRMFSKNSASSRAIPFNKMVKMVQDDPFIPIAWQKDHKGMQGTEYVQNEELYWNWLEARDQAVRMAKTLNEKGVTKQLCNRLLEPFMWHEVILTATEFENFFKQRCPQYSTPVSGEGFYARSWKDLRSWHSNPVNELKLEQADTVFKLQHNKGQAEIHMMALAEAMWDAYNESTPKQLQEGEWHIPFGDNIDYDKLPYNLYRNGEYTLEEIAVKIATARCARVSYLNYEGTDDYAKDLELYNYLVENSHCYTNGTEVLTNTGWRLFENLKEDDLIADISTKGEFNGFKKPLAHIKKWYEGSVYTYKQPDLDLEVTEDHTLIGVPINKYTDRSKNITHLESFKANEQRSKTSKYKTKGEQSLLMFSSVAKNNTEWNNDDFLKGKLYGFFIGDGHCKNKNTAYFRLKKPRKIEYITDLLNELKIHYTSRVDKSGVTNIAIKYNLSNCYSDGEKIIPFEYASMNSSFLEGLFDGLMNSDGSLKRKTWTYTTCSYKLKEQIKDLSCLIGISVRENKSTIPINKNQRECYKLMFLSSNKILVNDSRKDEKRVSINDYKGYVYCVTMPSGALMIRRNGKTVISGNCSPLEHCARVMTTKEYYSFHKGKGANYSDDPENEANLDLIVSESDLGWCLNYRGFIQHRWEVQNK